MRILYPRNSLDYVSAEVEEVVNGFLSATTACIGTKVDTIDLEAEWALKNPVHTTEPLEEYMKKVLAHVKQSNDAYLRRLRRIYTWLASAI